MVNFSKNTYISAEHSINHLQSKINDKKAYISPSSWKRGTLKTIIRRAYSICSTPDYLQKELDHIAYVFEKFHNCPKWVVKQLWEEVKYNHHGTSHEVLQINEVNNVEKSYILLLPYSGPKVEKLIRSMKKGLKSKIPDSIVTKLSYSAMRLKDKFNIKTNSKGAPTWHYILRWMSRKKSTIKTI